MPIFSGINSQNIVFSCLLLNQFSLSEHSPHTNKLLYSERYKCCLSLVASARPEWKLDVAKVTAVINFARVSPQQVWG